MVIELAVAVATAIVSEPVMALVHRFAFHGPLWCSHKSHHEHPTDRRVVRNDLLWSWPLLTSASLIYFGNPVLAGIGIGVIAYIAAYIFAHDGVAHGRFPVPRLIRHSRLFRRIAQTHQLHPRGGRDGVGAPPFGVYLAEPEYRWRLSVRYTPPSKICAPRA